MRILQVVNFFSPRHGGGSIEVVFQLSKALARQGHDIVIYTSDFELDKEYNDSLENVKVCAFKSLFGPYPISYTPDMIFEIKNNKNRFDVIHMHNYLTFQNIVASNYGSKQRIPLLLQAHGGFPRILGRKTVNSVTDLLFGKQIIKSASKVIAVSKKEVAECQAIGVPSSKIHMIPNGIDLELFKDLPAPGQFKGKYNLGSKKVLLFLGRIHEIKGLAFLTQAFALLVREFADLVLIVAGPDCGYERNLKELAKSLNCEDKIIFTGYLNLTEKLQAYVDADILINPSIFEVFGLVPFEAIMCGTPVIVTEDCGCGEWIKDMGAGYVVKYGDTSSLHNTIKECLTNPSSPRRMAQQGQKFIKDNLSWKIIAQKTAALYEACCSET